MKGPTGKRNASVSTVLYRRGYVPTGSRVAGQKYRSRSESNLTWQQSMRKVSVSPQRLVSTRSTHKSTDLFTVPTATSTSVPQPGYTSGKTVAQQSRPFVCSPVSVSKTSQKVVQTGPEPILKTKGASW